MVDVLSNCAQAVYSKWDRSPEHPSKTSYPKHKKFNKNSKDSRPAGSSECHSIRDAEMFRSKEICWTGITFKPTRPVMGASCKSCTPNSKRLYREDIAHFLVNTHEEKNCSSDDNMSKKEGLIDENIELIHKNRSMHNILRTPTEEDKSFIIRTFCHLTHNYRIKKYKYPQVAGSVLTDPRLKEAIVTTAETLADSVHEVGRREEKYRQILKEQEARANRILLDMRSTLSDFLLRYTLFAHSHSAMSPESLFTLLISKALVTSWLLHKLLPRFLTSVCLHPSQLDMLRKAANTNLPLIFVPLHRSHLDYILITFVLLNINVKSPLVAAGNNLKIPVFGWLLRGLGAFFIKRRIDPAAGKKDVLYRAVLHTYMMQCLRAGHNIEFYIEGGRTRTGKPCLPKGGLLSVIVDAYMAGTVQDALIVPVSVNYDKLVDGNFIRELLGQPKQMETFCSAMSAIWTTLNSNYGSMRIDFNQPFSLKELVRSFQSMNKLRRQSSNDLGTVEHSPTKNGYPREKVFRSVASTTSLYGTDVVDEDHRVLVDNIARHVIYDCARACAVMSTNLLAFLLLNKFRGGVKLRELVDSFEKLRDLLISENRDVGFSGNCIDVVNNAVELLGPNLVEKDEVEKCPGSGIYFNVITPVTILPNVIELSYYSNSLLSHFMIEGVIAMSIKLSTETFKSHGNEIERLTADTVMNHALEICEILQFEFIFTKPCQTLDAVLNNMFERFLLMELIISDETRSKCKFVSGYDSEDDDIFVPYKAPDERTFHINLQREESEKLEMFSVLLRPLMDSYIVTAWCLSRLLDDEMLENDFVQYVLGEIQRQVESGVCLYGESSSVEPIRNACKLFKKWGVLDVFLKDSVRFVSLTEDYNSPNMVTNVQRRLLRYKYYTEACRRES